MNSHRNPSPITVAALVAFACIALAGVLLVQPGDDASQRLGMLFGLLGAIVASLVGALRADHATRQLNGALDARMEEAVRRVVKPGDGE